MITQNQYGIYIDGGATNANNFNNVVIRLNSVAGIYSSGAVAGGNNATNNTFMGCIIESNGAYNGGAAGTRGTGIRLNNSYDFVFVGCYSENQQYSIYLASSSKGNKFFSHRTANGGFGNDAIIFDGAGIWDNTFTNCKASNDLATDVNFISNHADQHNNIMRDCEGYNFIAGSVTAMPDVFNMNPMPSNVYSGVGKIQMPQHGYLADVEEGTTAGRLEGIGTTTATLHTGGFGEIQMGGQVAAAGTNTTITTFTGLKPGQIFTLWNYQATRTVTIKSGTVTDDIVLKNATNATMNNYGQMIVFYVNGLGRAYEIGRNF